MFALFATWINNDKSCFQSILAGDLSHKNLRLFVKISTCFFTWDLLSLVLSNSPLLIGPEVMKLAWSGSSLAAITVKDAAPSWGICIARKKLPVDNVWIHVLSLIRALKVLSDHDRWMMLTKRRLLCHRLFKHNRRRAASQRLPHWVRILCVSGTKCKNARVLQGRVAASDARCQGVPARGAYSCIISRKVVRLFQWVLLVDLRHLLGWRTSGVAKGPACPAEQDQAFFKKKIF